MSLTGINNSFKVGDKVRVKKSVNAYSITTPGSWGYIIRKTGDSHYNVDFKYYASGYQNLTEYTIHESDLELFDMEWDI